MATTTLDAGKGESAKVLAGMAALGNLITVYGTLILIDVVFAALGFAGVPFDVGPPMPSNWFPNFLLGASIAGCGILSTRAARTNLSWAAVLGLFLALGAVYEIVLLDRLYAYQGRPALSATRGDQSIQDRLDRIYGGTLRVQIPR